MRPKNISGDKAKVEDAILHALNYLKIKKIYSRLFSSFTANISSQENEVDKVKKKLLKSKADSIFTSTLYILQFGNGERILQFQS